LNCDRFAVVMQQDNICQHQVTQVRGFADRRPRKSIRCIHEPQNI
jgi:hypothetical protein